MQRVAFTQGLISLLIYDWMPPCFYLTGNGNRALGVMSLRYLWSALGWIKLTLLTLIWLKNQSTWSTRLAGSGHVMGSDRTLTSSREGRMFSTTGILMANKRRKLFYFNSQFSCLEVYCIDYCMLYKVVLKREKWNITHITGTSNNSFFSILSGLFYIG